MKFWRQLFCTRVVPSPKRIWFNDVPLLDMNSSPIRWFELAKGNHVTTLRINHFPGTELGPHTWKHLYSSTRGFSCTLPKINCDSYTCQKTQIHVFRKLLTCLPRWHCLLSVTRTECKARQLSSVQVQGTCRNSPISHSHFLRKE
jgi:hypothetical protein